MSQNYFFPNMVPMQRGISEITNVSIPMNMLQIQPMPVQINPFVANTGVMCDNFSGFYQNLPKWAPENHVIPVCMNNQKENIPMQSSGGMNLPPNNMGATNGIDTPIVENISTTQASRSNETSSELKK